MDGTRCELCGEPAQYCDSVPDASNSRQGEMAYRRQLLCWIHAVDRRMVATSRVEPVMIWQNVAYRDMGRASGEAICEDCGREFKRHPHPMEECPTQVILCGARTAKL